MKKNYNLKTISLLESECNERKLSEFSEILLFPNQFHRLCCRRQRQNDFATGILGEELLQKESLKENSYGSYSDQLGMVDSSTEKSDNVSVHSSRQKSEILLRETSEKDLLTSAQYSRIAHKRRVSNGIAKDRRERGKVDNRISSVRDFSIERRRKGGVEWL